MIKANRLDISFSKKIRVIALLSLGFLFTGCSDYLDLETTHVASEDKQWTSLADTRSAIIGVYGLFRAAVAENNAHWIYGELRKGEFTASSRLDLKAVVANNLDASYPILQDLSDWRRFYAVINAASVFIEKAPLVLAEDSRYSEANLNLDIAQARALRAFAYFYMVRIWGDVPLITQAYDNGSFEEQPKSDQDLVLSYAESELLAVANKLPYLYGVYPQSYYGQDQYYWNGVLLNKISIYALLAHIAAWKGNYADANAYSTFVMDNYMRANIEYTSVNNLTSTTGLFSERSPSQIVSFGFIDADGESSKVGHIEDLTLAQPFVSKEIPDIYVPKDSIIKIFAYPYDLRFGLDTIAQTYRTNYFTNYNGAVPVFSKIKVLRDGYDGDPYALFGSALIFTRIEEITLLRAEALAALNREEEAIIYLNRIRTERGLPLFIKEEESDDVFKEIFSERRRELMGEGWRWYDQIRYQRLKQQDPDFVELEAQGGIYWPISERVLTSNSLIEQNSYWK